MEGGAAPGAGRVGIPAPSHWVRDSVAACEGITVTYNYGAWYRRMQPVVMGQDYSTTQ